MADGDWRVRGGSQQAIWAVRGLGCGIGGTRKGAALAPLYTIIGRLTGIARPAFRNYEVFLDPADRRSLG